MDKSHSIPAGLIDDNIEFFNSPNNPEEAYCLYNKAAVRVNEAPSHILAMIDADMLEHPDRIEALVELGYETVEAQREKYISCCFGAFDGSADAVDGKLIHSEYWNCPKRGICPVEGKLCDGLLVGNGQALTRREIDVLALVCELDKVIADKLNISEQTVKVHMKHIREKTGLEDKKALVKLAIQKNLIS